MKKPLIIVIAASVALFLLFYVGGNIVVDYIFDGPKSMQMRWMDKCNDFGIHYSMETVYNRFGEPRDIGKTANGITWSYQTYITDYPYRFVITFDESAYSTDIALDPIPGG